MNHKQPPFSLPNKWMSIGGARQWLIYRPLAVLMAILMLPVLSQRSTGADSQGLFQAAAQTVGSACTPTGNAIIRNYCVNGVSYATSLIALEQQAVEAVLAMHGMTAADAPTLYNLGRQDLRNQVRGMIHALLTIIIGKNPAERTTRERDLYLWAQNLIQGYEIKMNEKTLEHYNQFRLDPCRFFVDTDLGKVYGVSFNSAAYCTPGGISTIFQAPVPNAAYFHAYGYKKSYFAKGDPTESGFNPDYPEIFMSSARSTAEIFGVGLAVGYGTALAGGIGLGISFGLAIAAAVTSAAATGTGVTGAAAGVANMGALFAVSSSTLTGSALGAGLAVVGPLAMVAVGALIFAVAAMQLSEDLRQTQEILTATQALAAARSALPDLAKFVADKTGLGQLKLQHAFVSEMVPDFPSNLPLPAPQAGDLSFVTEAVGGGQQTYRSSIRHLDYFNNTRTTRVSGNWLISTCEANPFSAKPCVSADSILGSLEYVDSNLNRWRANRSGEFFTSTKAKPAPTDVPCPADPIQLISLQPDLSKCISFVSKSLLMLDENANPFRVRLSKTGPPVFLDPGPLSFGIGVPASKSVRAVANPPAEVCLVNGGGPNFTIPNCGTGDSIPINFNGARTTTPTSFPVLLRATNSVGSVTQTFTVKLETQLAIVSTLDCTTFSFGCHLPVVYGQNVNYRVVATGNPTPMLTLDTSGSDFTGLTFTDNGDGTGDLRGTALGSPFSNGTCGVTGNAPCGGFTAFNNTQPTVMQRFRLGIGPAPEADLDTPSTAQPTFVFPPGVPTEVVLRTRGNTTPVTWTLASQPSWLSLTVNGDSTATLRGTPPLNSGEWFNPAVGMTAAGSLLKIRRFLVQVPQVPTFTSATTATFRVGNAGSFDITASLGSIDSLWAPPPGLTFTPGNPARITGTPARGTGGTYLLPMTASSPGGTTSTETLNLVINEAPSIPTSNLAVMFAGRPGSFEVLAIGHPTLGTLPASTTGAPDPAMGMRMSGSGLPASLQASNQNGLGRNTGALRISGTPTSADIGTRRLTITAGNTIGSNAAQTLNLQVIPYNATQGVSLLSFWSLSRDSSGNVIAQVVVANQGSQPATNVAITSARIGTTTGTVFPSQIPSIGAGQTQAFRIQFPPSVGVSGMSSVLSLAGSHQGGTFNNTGRVLLP